MPAHAAPESQITPVVTGTDIFAFGSADLAPGPGEKEQEPATPAPAKEDHPGEASETPATEIPQPPPEGDAGKEIKPRFKDHSAAEEGYRNLQSQATKAQQEAAELRKRLAEYEAQQAAHSDSERQAAVDKAIDEFEVERNEKALKEIEDLDPDDPEHQKKVARIWAACHKDVRRFASAPVDKDGKPIAAPRAQKPSAGPETPQLPPEGDVAPAEARSARTSPQEGKSQTAEQIRAAIDAKVRKAGIDPEDELWVGVALTTPDTDADGKRMSVDQQIEWTINRYNEKKAAYQARARQEAGLPLGEGGSPPRAPAPGAGAEPAGPIGLGDAIARANERRRL